MADRLSRAVERLRRGDRDAAEEIDRQLRPRLRSFFRPGPWPLDESEDLVQTTLALVFKNVQQLENPERFLPWLFAIARNVRSTAAGRWSARRRVETVGLDSAEEPRAPSGEAERFEDQRRADRTAELHRALAELPERQRQCLLLQSREQMSYGEIAATLRLSAHTVRNHIAQARESLRRRLRQTETR